MKNVLTIIKKEFSRFFKDRRMLITILLPGILIYVLYSVMGAIFSDGKGEKPTAYVMGVPTEYIQFTEDLGKVLDISKEELTEDAAIAKVSAGELDVLIIWAENKDGADAVSIYYNSVNETSTQAYSIAVAVLDAQHSDFIIKAPSDLAEEGEVAASILSMLIPMLMFSLLASACIAVAPESIAGEKERGTMATMLITPIKRWQLALGKIISLSCFALISGISSFLGVILSLPKLTGGLGVSAMANYSAGAYFGIFGVIISIVLIIISAFSVLSALAKSVKEASTLITPLMIVIILLGLATMFVSASPSIGLFLIPLLGSGLAISSIMAMTASPLAVALSIISNLVVTALLVVLLAFMFRSERIMFKK